MAGEPANTGYTRALIAPGVAFSHPDGWKLYADLDTGPEVAGIRR
jgi:hypothetical protein